MARDEWFTAVLADTPAGLWRCNEGTGAPEDEGSTAATLDSGSNSWTTDGTYGDVLVIGAGAWSTAVTVSGSVSITQVVKASTASWSTLVSAIGADQSVTLYADNSNGTEATAANTDGVFDFAGAQDVTETITDWTVLTAVLDGDDLTLYADGSSVATDTLAEGALSQTLTVGFGGYDGGAVGGLCAGIAVFDAALTPTEVSDQYDAWVAAAAGSPVTFEPDAIEVAVDAPAAAFGAATLPIRTGDWPGGAENAPGWESTFGEPISIDKPLNSYERATIRVPDSWAQPANLAAVEITRNGHRHFSGRRRNFTDDSSIGSLDYQCFGDWHLFTQRYAGGPQRRNFLTNGHFEDNTGAPSLAGWGAVGCSASSETDVVLSGKAAVRLTWGGPDEDEAHYDSTFTHKTSVHGSRFYCAAWCFIDGSFEPGYRTFGLRARWTDTVNSGDVATFIDATHPTNQWTRHYIELPVPADIHAIVVFELWAPIGAIVWDHCQAVANTADGSPTPAGSDQCLVAGEFVRSAQRAPKADLGIAIDTPLSGINSTELMVHYRHEQVATKVETMATREEGFDFAVVADGDAKVFRTFFPRRGSDKGTITFPGEVLAYRRTEMGIDAVSSVVTTGDANDPAREEGGAWDDSALDGLLLETVRPMPQGASVGLLNPKAERYLREGLVAPQAVDVDLTADDGEGYDPGDIVTFTASRGEAGFSAEYRIVNWHANCLRDVVTLSLVRWVDPEE